MLASLNIAKSELNLLQYDLASSHDIEDFTFSIIHDPSINVKGDLQPVIIMINC